MQKAHVFVFLVLGAVETAMAAGAAASAWRHTVPLGRWAGDLLREAASESTVVTGLLEALERTDVVVYVTDMKPGRSGSHPASLTFLSHDPTGRYLVIRIDPWHASRHDRMALLGHELQHALEVASASDVLDSASMIRLYRRIGWEADALKFETKAAQTAGLNVRRELFGGRRP